MNLNKIEQNILNLLILICSIFFLYISQNNYYGSDHDTFSQVDTFIRIIEEGKYYRSRTFGFPVSEILLGGSIFFLGDKITSLIIAIIFSLSIIIFFIAFKKIEKNNLNFKIFILLCFTNPILVFDNLNIIDYPISLFFFSLGCFFSVKKEYILMSIFFGICLGCRINFALFIIIYLVFYQKIQYQILFKNLFLIFFIGGLFYLPFLISINFSYNSFNEIKTLGGIRFDHSANLELGFAQISRFFYKIIFSFGLIPALVIMWISFKLFKDNEFQKIFRYKTEIIIILSNLLLFFLLPTKTAIISIVTIFVYLIITELSKKEYLYIIILFNIISFFISMNFININYRYSDPCKPKQAMNAKIQFYFDEGHIKKYLNKSYNNMKCSVIELPFNYGSKFLIKKNN
tara:strand:- start:12698 stop:13903 length:1206 start_codon:yes stop_codon:yes gene_type:complete